MARDAETPVAGIRILVGGPGGHAIRRIGVTDSEGRLAWAPGAYGRLSFSASGETLYADPVDLVVTETTPASTEILLQCERAVTKAGRVVWASGQPVSEPVQVYAWPLGRAPPVEALLQREDLHAPASRATNRSDGWFELFGLPGESRIQVAVAADGCLFQEQYARTVEPGDEVGNLVIERLFGGIVTLLDETGSDLVAPRGSYGIDGATYRSLDPRASTRQTKLGGLALPLAGIDRGMIEVDGWKRRFVMMAGPEDALEAGPVSFSVSIPGYFQKVTDFAVPRLGASIYELPVYLDRSRVGVGVVRLLLMDENRSEEELTPTGFASPEGVLSLVDHEGEIYEIPVSPLVFNEPITIESVPIGHYSVTFTFTSGRSSLFWPERLIVDGSSDPRPITFDVSAFGSMEIKVQTPLGGSITGPLTVRLVADPERSRTTSRWAHFDDSPYRLDGLKCTTYQVSLRRPVRSTGTSFVKTGSVEPGRTTLVLLVDDHEPGLGRDY